MSASHRVQRLRPCRFHWTYLCFRLLTCSQLPRPQTTIAMDTTQTARTLTRPNANTMQTIRSSIQKFAADAQNVSARICGSCPSRVQCKLNDIGACTVSRTEWLYLAVDCSQCSPVRRLQFAVLVRAGRRRHELDQATDAHYKLVARSSIRSVCTLWPLLS